MSHGTHAQILMHHVADTERYHTRIQESLHTYTHVTESRHRHRVVGSHTCERPAAHIDTDKRYATDTEWFVYLALAHMNESRHTSTHMNESYHRHPVVGSPVTLI